MRYFWSLLRWKIWTGHFLFTLVQRVCPLLSELLKGCSCSFLLYFYSTCKCVISSCMTWGLTAKTATGFHKWTMKTFTKNKYVLCFSGTLIAPWRHLELCVTFEVVFERPLVELAEAASYQSHSGLLRSWADISIWKCPPPPHRWLHWRKGLNGKHQPLQIKV